MFILCDATVTTDVRFQSRGMGRTDGAGILSYRAASGGARKAIASFEYTTLTERTREQCV